jgi:hypothetical protein
LNTENRGPQRRDNRKPAARQWPRIITSSIKGASESKADEIQKKPTLLPAASALEILESDFIDPNSEQTQEITWNKRWWTVIASTFHQTLQTVEVKIGDSQKNSLQPSRNEQIDMMMSFDTKM